jgi:hypothetical protein
MKTLATLALFISSTAFAQNMTAVGLKNLMTQRQASLEAVNAGMSKKLVHNAKLSVEGGECAYRLTTTQTILKIDGEKMLIFSREKFQPAATAICANAQITSNEDLVLFYEAKPSLALDLADVDASIPTITSIVRAGEIITLNMNVDVPAEEEGGVATKESLVVKYDLTKSSFRNTILTQGSDFSTTGEDVLDIDPRSVDLKKVLFCENNDGDNSDCVEGDFSGLAGFVK